jgi:hypothetical protein
MGECFGEMSIDDRKQSSYKTQNPDRDLEDNLPQKLIKSVGLK